MKGEIGVRFRLGEKGEGRYSEAECFDLAEDGLEGEEGKRGMK